MNIKRKHFAPKKKLKYGKRFGTERKEMNEKTFIQNTMKILSFDN